MMFDQLSSLTMSRTSWRIKVRVTRMWPSIASSAKGDGSLKGYNFILLDDDNCHIHAYVYANTWNSIADKMVEGGLYIISNFYTKEAKGSLKPVTSKFIINFSPSTTVDRIDKDDFMIPMHKFEFLDLGDLYSIATSYQTPDFPDFSVDMIGVIEDFENVSEIKTCYGDRNIVKFRITDGRYSHKVSVWGQHAINIDARHREITERPIIAILASTKLKTFRTSVQISTLPSSKIYLNLDIDVVTEMKQRLEEEGYKPTQNYNESQNHGFIESADALSQLIETVSLKELSEKTSQEFLERYFLCKVQVTNVEETDNWWYKSCINCYEEVTKLDGAVRCVTCNKNLPVFAKRYHILILAGDGTEAFNFVLLDRAAKRIIGKTATNFISELLKDNSTESFPAKIKEITGKEITLKIQIRDDNVLLNSSLFYATDAFETVESDTFIPEPPKSGYSGSSIGESNFVDLSGYGDTPGSAKSCNKKIKMEK